MKKKKAVTKEPIQLFVGRRVTHPMYGPGAVVVIEKNSRFDVRHVKHPDAGIKFDNGGPQGFNEDSTNQISVLEAI
jgi:hypothetical protein